MILFGFLDGFFFSFFLLFVLMVVAVCWIGRAAVGNPLKTMQWGQTLLGMFFGSASLRDRRGH